MIKYKTWLDRIEEVEVERETEKTVWVKHRHHLSNKPYIKSERKTSSHTNFFDTWTEAKFFLETEKQNEIKAAKLRIKLLNHDLARIKAMKKGE